ncbi:hypothetical protein [Motilimonas eburnea]|uniref:hypothetical protein n=1 Tax=Motilimonas eburnea TaxID=1737488 RepID=UPI001E3A8300|nr:hypothetical protein [Motilimonas eburnea]MCE2570704.1 hypothetical protein [Motilimonas eburnea]
MNQPAQINSISQLETVNLSELQSAKPVARSKPRTAAKGEATNGVAVNAYGQGQCSGVTYTVPAHGQIEVEFEIKMQCITPEGIESMNKLIRGMLDASKQHEYDELSKKSISGGISFLPFFGSAKASYEDTKHTMDKWGLSEKNQEEIVTKMLALANEMNTFKYKGTVYNKDYDYDVTGNMFAIVMDCEIKKEEQSSQQRYIGPDAHLTTNEGETLPAVGKLY